MIEQTCPSIDALLREAAAAWTKGDAAASASRYHEVLRQSPEQPVALNGLGMIELARDPAAAAQWFERATIRDPGALALWLNLATAHRANRDEAGERQALDAALGIDQTDLAANVRLAELLDRRGEEDLAFVRWQGVATLLQGMVERPKEYDALLATARQRVADHFRIWGQEVDTLLTGLRGVVAPAQRRRFDACVDIMLGRRTAYTNICHGLYFPFLPADEFFERRNFPWLADAEALTGQIRAEFEALFADGAPDAEAYVQMLPGTPANKWTPLDRSRDWSAIFLYKHGERNEDICARCPATTALLERLPLARIEGKGPTAFFSILQPGTRLPAHTGVTNIRAIVHLPLIVPPACGFRVGGETRAWREGEAFAFDDTIEHEAWNDSDRPRTVLIFDVWNPHLTLEERELVSDLFRLTAHHGTMRNAP